MTTKSEGRHMWDNAANPEEETAALYVMLQELRATVEAMRVHIPGPLHVRHEPGPIWEAGNDVLDRPPVAPPVRGPAPNGGSRADKPLFGYQSDERGGACDWCKEPPESHGCPEVKND